MIEHIDIAGLHCVYIGNKSSRRIAYILYPMDISPEWIVDAAAKYGISIAVLTGMNWDDDLTPWGAPGEPKGSPDFKGNADEFLKRLTTDVLPRVEELIGYTEQPERSLIGVSLSGLFTLWQWARCELFDNIATLSGSFWYEGFARWIESQSFAGKTGRCFMLLGDAEPRSKNPLFATVGNRTAEIAGYLRRQGVNITYEIVKGNHYQYPAERLAMAMADLFSPKSEPTAR
ncbi:MAG: alpha/beta hydrolase-fold protein [[Clostridium] fimetarium]|nr:alpha/beta hydrolase-fold protein [Alistipes timonensis]MCM1406127.1 alpha/beta hydrolase-fold protein [[Clostridium] fimetarium]